MSNELTLAGLTNLPVSKVATTSLTEYKTSGDFLSRLQLINPQSKYVALSKIPAGNYGIPSPNDEIQDMGGTVDIIPLAVRDKAMDLSDPGNPIAVFDPNTDLYQDICMRSDIKDSGCVFGPSLLVFERSSERFLELYLGNKSGRFVAGDFEQFLPISEAQAEEFGIESRGPLTCTLGSQFMERPRQAWYAPTVGPCSTPFQTLPTVEDIVEEVAKFVSEGEAKDTPQVAETGGRSR